MRLVASPGIRKRKVGGTVVEAKERPNAEVPVDRVQVERRHRNVMRVGEPASFARALPGVLAGLFGKLPRRGVPDAGPRPVKSDPHRRAARDREYRGAELPVHVDHQIVAVFAARGKTRVADKRRQPPGCRPVFAVKLDNIADGRMVAEEFADRRRDQPIQLRGRVTAPQLVQHRDGVNDVADGGQFDQQNFAEVAIAQVGRRRVQKLTPVARRLLCAQNSYGARRGPVRFFAARA